jgi:hypothetical protein
MNRYANRNTFFVLYVGLLVLVLFSRPARAAGGNNASPPPAIGDFEDANHMVTRANATNYLNQYYTWLGQAKFAQLRDDTLATVDLRDWKKKNPPPLRPNGPVPLVDPIAAQDLLEAVVIVSKSFQPPPPAQPKWLTDTLSHLVVVATYQDIRNIQDPRDRVQSSTSKQVANSTAPPSGAGATQNPATFSFARNNLTASNQWTIKASVSVLGNVLDGPFGGRFQWVPSFSIDREFNNINISNSVDSMTFRLGNIYENIGDRTDINFGTLRLAGDYGTDTSFESLLAGGELDWTPNLNFFNEPTLFGGWRPLMGYGKYGSLFGIHGVGNWVPQVRWDVGLHTQYTYTVKAGKKHHLKGDPSYLGIGPLFNVSLQPLPYTVMNLNRFIINFSYEYLGGAVGDPGASHNLNVTAAYPLLGSGPQSLNLTASYQTGLAPIVKDKVDSLIVGLGVKF